MRYWLARHAHLLVCMLAIIVITGCQHNRARDFNRVQIGMDKSQVLDLLGGPDRSRRWQGKDRWTYIDEAASADTARDVHFEEGRVVYSGPPPKTKISAGTQDQLNEERNANAEAGARADQDAERAARQERALKIQNAIEREDLDEAAKVVPRYEPVQ